MVETFRALVEGATGRRAHVLLCLRKDETAHSSSAVDWLISWRYALPEVGGPVALGEPPLGTVGAEAGLAVVVLVAAAGALVLLSGAKTRPAWFFC